ncbi:MAG: hemin receptor [Gammaproteobacteria bacterium]|nr:hemin receptor [Gammaproteobacteria bacterium]
MTPETVRLVQDSFSKVVPIAPQAGALFYKNLFSIDPNLKSMFKGDINAQGEKLMQLLGTAVNQLNDLDRLVPILQDLGKRHAQYGVQDSHYETVGAALLITLAQGLGDAFTAPVKNAWTDVYGVMARTMKDAADDHSGASG